MLHVLRKKNAQAIMGEYILVFFVVLGVMTAMTVYIKRLIQARIHDGRDYMIRTVRQETAGIFNGNLYVEYEPYYDDMQSNVARSSIIRREVVESPGLSSGIFRKNINDTTTVRAIKVTAPPVNADEEYGP